MSLRKSNMSPDQRPDLAAMPDPMPVGFIGEKIFPTLPRFGRTGTLFYQAYAAYLSATTNRASGGTVSRTAVTASRTTYSTGEVLMPLAVDEQEIVEMGGDDKAEKILALRGIRGVAKKLEILRLAAIATVGYTDISSTDLITFNGINNAVSAILPKIMGHTGTLALLGGSSALNKLRSNTYVVDRMKNIGAPVNADVRRIARSAMAEMFNVQDVFEGQDGFWPSGALVLAFCPDPNEDPTVSAQAGRLVKYQFDGQGTEVSCECGYDPAIRSAYLDFVSYAQVLTLNADFIVPLQIGASITTG